MVSYIQYTHSIHCGISTFFYIYNILSDSTLNNLHIFCLVCWLKKPKKEEKAERRMWIEESIFLFNHCWRNWLILLKFNFVFPSTFLNLPILKKERGKDAIYTENIYLEFIELIYCCFSHYLNNILDACEFLNQVFGFLVPPLSFKVKRWNPLPAAINQFDSIQYDQYLHLLWSCFVL